VLVVGPLVCAVLGGLAELEPDVESVGVEPLVAARVVVPPPPPPPQPTRARPRAAELEERKRRLFMSTLV
jgi:hypothetical protein